MRKLKQEIFEHPCCVCHTKYETTSSWGKYCSDACRQKAFRKRKKLNNNETVTQLHNVVTLLRKNKVTDKCNECNAKRTLLEQTVNNNLCFKCFSPNWSIIDSIKKGLYPESLYGGDKLFDSVKNGDYDEYLANN